MLRALSAGLTLAVLLRYASGSSNDFERSNFKWEVPTGGTRTLLSESDHKYQKQDRIKLYGKLRLIVMSVC